MPFRKISPSTASFNSDASSFLVDFYKMALKARIQREGARQKSRTFAPSCMRCQRKSWFRLRGAEPDFLQEPDMVLDHTATVGTALHEHIQAILSDAFGEDWISVSDYLKEFPIPYKYTLQQSGYETLIEIDSPPIKFACDGIIRMKGTYYLLEIKSSEYNSWLELNGAKEHHKEQIRTYATILNIPHILTLYIDRLYGDVKSYEMSVSGTEMSNIKQGMEYVMQMAKANIAPERLPTGDYLCSNCEYKKKCKEW
jgi:hypothetical protein